jgi:hypothetical protein
MPLMKSDALADRLRDFLEVVKEKRRLFCPISKRTIP